MAAFLGSRIPLLLAVVLVMLEVRAPNEMMIGGTT